MSENIKKKEFSLNDAPPPAPEEIEEIINNQYYNCSECSSIIEILSLNENNNIIEFKCINKNHNNSKKIMEINEYLDKMKVYNKENIIKDICETHNNNKYTSYCFKCNKHLCNDCLKTRKHIDHLKNNIIEIQPLKEELDIIQEVIKNYKIKVEILKKEKMIKQKN